MSEIEKNKAIAVRWFNEVWNEGQVATIDELYAPGGIAHGLADGKPIQIKGPSEFKKFHTKFREGLPDIHFDFLDVIAEGDRVVLRCKVTGTHKGCSLGCEATNKKIEFTGVSILRVKNGQIHEGWNEYDFLRLYKDIGAIK